MNIFLTITRWLAFVPAALISWIIATWAVFYGISFGIPDVATAVRHAPDFAGHIFLEPLIVFIWFSVATAVGIYAGISVAPSHKKIAASILALVALAFVGAAFLGLVLSPDRQFLTGRMWLRTSTELIGMITGLVSGIALAYESGAFSDQRPASTERMT